MENLPVGKRTRSQRARMLTEQNKKARLSAKREWRKKKKKKEGVSEGGSGKKDGILRGLKDDDDDDGNAAMVIDKEEFIKFSELEEKSEIEEMGIVKKEAFDLSELGKVSEIQKLGFVKGETFDLSELVKETEIEEMGIIKEEVFDFVHQQNGLNGDESDDSLQILGERWNPLGSDEDGDERKVDEVKNGGKSEEKEEDAVISEESSSSSSSEEDDDKDFMGEESESSDDSDQSSSSSSSSDCSVQEVDETKLHYSDNVDDNVDDDEEVVGEEDVVISEKYDDHKSKHIENRERIEVESGEKRKRGRPRKNTNTFVLESQSPSNNRVKKPSKDNELQNTILNTILQVGNNGLDEILCNANKSYLPLKFEYGVTKIVEVEKEEEELEVDSLFKELEFSYQAYKIGANDIPMYDNDGDNEDDPTNEAISQKDLCAKGKHYLILDDEIGVICKFCSHVYLEIKHVTPDFNKNLFGRGNRREYDRFLYEDKISCNGFQFPDSSYDRRGDYDYPNPLEDVQGTVWDLVPGVKATLYPHQRDGFEFIWKNIAGSIKIDELGNPSSYGLGGCIICHAPGTGKTRLAIVFLQSFMKQYKMANPVIVAPCSMLRTWEEEFKTWNVDIPFFSLNDHDLSGKEDPKILNYAGDTKDKKTIRSIKLLTWASGKGVLGISYSLLQRLAGEQEGADEKVREILIRKPGILVLDEGHTPRNEKSNIWKVLSQLSTKRRVILSGTPFQNNFEELHNIISLVREEAEGPVLSGYYEQDDRRIAQLRKRIKPFVHVHKGEILRQTLKGLFHSLIILKPSSLQKLCFDHLARVRLSCFSFDNFVSLTSVHPSIFCNKNVRNPSFIDDEFKDLLKKHKMDLDAGVKTRFLVELIEMSKGERVLVFGQYIPPLIFIGNLLKIVFGWTMGSELLYMHGQQDLKERQSMIKVFNDPRSEARVLLASTKACCEGIHLVGASRVVLLDVVWNPSVERQAISRAYRLGQKKDVFVYHLITSGTLEEDKYQRQASKERLGELMFASSEEERMEKKSTKRSRISEDRVLEEMLHNEKMKDLFVRIIYHPKNDDFI
ncbi:hypothetical protein SOVF_013750 [Spinacia oleracea]|nr:hypothetical protein SOVF_013750 [Spinacia oleracea]